jgi:glycine/D-amino acid oxidase-like deaminating enzyme
MRRGTDESPARTLAVIGAGPAGLAAALAAAVRGSRVTLIDAGARAGGQFYRQPAEELGARRPQALHHQWRTWERLRDGLAEQVGAGRITHLTDHHVWCVERLDEASCFLVHALHGPAQEEPSVVRADAVILATGAYEKVLPFPGWTLPGVITAGGAQAMLKGGLVLQGRTAVVAGTFRPPGQAGRRGRVRHRTDAPPRAVEGPACCRRGARRRRARSRHRRRARP